MKSRLWCAIFSLLLFGFALGVSAATFQFSFSGIESSSGNAYEGSFIFDDSILVPLTSDRTYNDLYTANDRLVGAKVFLNGGSTNDYDPNYSATSYGNFIQINDHDTSSPYPFDEVAFGLGLIDGTRLVIISTAVNSLVTGNSVPWPDLGGTPWSVTIRHFISSSSGEYLNGQALSITSVPLPAAVWLFGSGILGLVGIAGRKKTA